MTSEDNYTNAGSHQIKFSITENIQKLGIKELTLE